MKWWIATLLVLFAASPAGARQDTFWQKLIASVPKLAMLADADPAAFDLIAGIYERGEKAGTPQDQLIGQARAAYAAYQQDRLAHAPDAFLLQSLDSTIAVADDLLAKAPERCAALFTGGNAGDIGPFLSASTKASEDAVYAASLRAPRIASPAVATKEVMGRPIMLVIAETAARLGKQPRAMIEEWMRTRDASAMCRLQRDVLATIRRDPDGAAIMRARLTGPPAAADR